MPSLAVEVVVIHNSKILLILREDVRIWSLPGGAVKARESVSQAAVRETYEETGVLVELTRLVGIYSRPQWGLDGDHAVVFTARPVAGQPRPLDGEALDVRYFDPLDMPKPMFWWQLQRIHDALHSPKSVSWMQDVEWPFGQLTRREARQHFSEGRITIDHVVNSLGGNPRPHKEFLEVGEWLH